MKRIIIITLAIILSVYKSGIAQTYIQVFNVKTPNNSTVQDTYSLSSSDFSFTQTQLEALEEEIYWNYNGARLLEAPSLKYNCHGYAWHVSEGGEKVWIGYDYVTTEDIYWTDGKLY